MFTRRITGGCGRSSDRRDGRLAGIGVLVLIILIIVIKNMYYNDRCQEQEKLKTTNVRDSSSIENLVHKALLNPSDRQIETAMSSGLSLALSAEYCTAVSYDEVVEESLFLFDNYLSERVSNNLYHVCKKTESYVEEAIYTEEHSLIIRQEDGYIILNIYCDIRNQNESEEFHKIINDYILIVKNMI